MTPRKFVAVTFAVMIMALSPVAVGATPQAPGSFAVDLPTAVRTFATCTAMNKVYSHGVGRKGARDRVSGTSRPVTNFHVSTTIYNANTARDRDKDGVACEKR